MKRYKTAPKAVNITVRFTEEEYDQIDDKRAYGETDSQLIRRLLHEYHELGK